MQDTGFAQPDYIEVDVHSLAEAGRFLQRLGKSLDGAISAARSTGARGLAAIPSSDLFESYVFCWGRWSATLPNAHDAIVHSGTAVEKAAGTFHAADRAAARVAGHG